MTIREFEFVGAAVGVVILCPTGTQARGFDATRHFVQRFRRGGAPRHFFQSRFLSFRDLERILIEVLIGAHVNGLSLAMTDLHAEHVVKESNRLIGLGRVERNAYQVEQYLCSYCFSSMKTVVLSARVGLTGERKTELITSFDRQHLRDAARDDNVSGFERNAELKQFVCQPGSGCGGMTQAPQTPSLRRRVHRCDEWSWRARQDLSSRIFLSQGPNVKPP